MSQEHLNSWKEVVGNSFDEGELTLEELSELGTWCVGKSLGTALKKGLEVMMSNGLIEQSDDPESRPKTP